MNKQRTNVQQYQLKDKKMWEGKNISPEGAKNLKNFKYKGGSMSYSYTLLWSPLAQKIVKFVPPTLSPNLITLIGTIFHIVGNLVMIIQQPDKQCWPPFILIFGLFVFIYYTLDNVDGKQARKTGSSSPLGMCMDHGCDALGVSFICIGLCRTVLYTNNAVLLLCAQIAVLGTFWFSAWYQYHNNGVLVLGKFNAVDDGVPAVAFFGIGTYLIGQQFWIQQYFGLFTNQHFLIVIVWSAGLAQIISFIWFSDGQFSKNVKKSKGEIIHFILIISSLILIICLTNWHNEYLIAIYFSSTFVIVRNTSILHVSVCTKEKFNQWQLPTIVFIIGYPILALITYFFNPSQIIQSIMVYAMFSFFAYQYFSYVVKTANQMADILSIRVWKIKPQIKDK